MLCHETGTGSLWTNGFTAMTDRPSEKLASSVNRAVGLTLDELMEIYLACVPERFREGMRGAGVPV